jgi:hypothetical protein
MNVTAKGSIMYKTVAEVRTILEKVLNSTQYTGVFDDPPTDQPKEKQQVHTLSAPSSPPPPHIEEIIEFMELDNA